MSGITRRSHGEFGLRDAQPLTHGVRDSCRLGRRPSRGPGPQHGHKLPAPQRLPKPAPSRAGGALCLSQRDRRNLRLGSVPRRQRRALDLLGGVEPGTQRVGAILGPVRSALGGLCPIALGAAICVRGVGPTLGGPPVGFGCLGPGFRPIRAIALRFSSFVRLIRPKPFKIGHLLGPVRPLAFALQGFLHGVMTGRLSSRLFGRTRARLHLRIVGHQDERPAIVAGLGPPPKTARPQPHSLSRHAESFAGLSVGQPVGHAVSRRVSGRLIGWLTG
jgi:hypothetical protein